MAVGWFEEGAQVLVGVDERMEVGDLVHRDEVGIHAHVAGLGPFEA